MRGGTLDIGAEVQGGTTEIAIRAAGPRIAFDPLVGKALDGSLAPGDLSSKTAPSVMIRELAESLGGWVQVALGSDALVLGAVLPGR